MATSWYATFGSSIFSGLSFFKFKAFYFFQSNFQVLSLCSHLKIELCDVVNLHIDQQTQIKLLVSAKFKKSNVWYQLKWNRASDIAFNWNQVSFFIEMDFIQNEAKKIASKKGSDENIFCRDLNYLTKTSWREPSNTLI